MSGESEQVLLFLSWRLAEQEAPCTIGETIIATLTTNVIDNVDDDADAGHVDDWSSWKPHAPSIGEMVMIITMWSPMHYFVFLSL